MSLLSLPSPWLHMVAAVLSCVLGAAYIVRAPRMIEEFKLVLIAHRRTLVMALVSQGILLCFIGVIIIIARLVSPDSTLSRTLSFVCAGLLLLLSVWTGSTGARSEHFLLKISHFVTITAAGFVLLGNAQG